MNTTIMYEQALLGRCILDGICPAVSLEDWEHQAHRLIHGAMIDLAQGQDVIDLVSVCERLAQSGRLKEAGGSEYVAMILDASCSRKAIETFERVVRESGHKRRLFTIISQYAAQKQKLVQQKTEEWLPQLRDAIDAFADAGSRQRDPESIADVVKRELVAIEKRRACGSGIVGITTGLESLDKCTGGLIPGDLIIIAGRPGTGKTALATQIAAAASEAGATVMFFSMEMPREQIAMRMLAQQAGVDILGLRTGRLSDHEHAKVIRVAPTAGALNIIIDDTAGLTEYDVVAKARKYKPNLVILDYLTLCRSLRDEERRDLEVANISRTLKALAKEMQIPVIILSQLNRAVEARTNKRPMCSDLRDSGAIEQDADLILLLYRDEIYNPDTKDKGVAEIIIGKQRNGPVGYIRTYFDQKSATFRTLADDVSL